MDYVKIVKELISTFKEAFSYEIKHAKFNKTYTSQIISKSGNTYTVMIKGKKYPVKSEFDFDVGSYVKIIDVQNDFSDLYIMPNDSALRNVSNWKYLGTGTRGVAVNLPANYNELYIEVYDNGFILPLFIPKFSLSYTKQYLGGSYWSAPNSYGTHVQVNENTVTLINACYGEVPKNESIVAVYYR